MNFKEGGRGGRGGTKTKQKMQFQHILTILEQPSLNLTMKYPASSSILNSVSFTWVGEVARWWFYHIWDGRLADQVNWIILLMVNTRQLLLPRGNRIHIYCTNFLSIACVHVLFASFCMSHCALDLAGSNVPQKCPLIVLLHAALYRYYALQCIYCNTIWDTTWLQCQTQFGCTVTWKPCWTKLFFILSF